MRDLRNVVGESNQSSFGMTSRLLASLSTSDVKSSPQNGGHLMLGPRMKINEDYPGLSKIYSNPDIFVIEDFLTVPQCQDIVQRARSKTLQQSPVAYAGWTDDFQDLMELVLKGPVSWLSLIIAWFQVKDNTASSDVNPTVDLVIHAIQNFGVLLVVAVIGIGLFTKSRADGLQQLRTSTSTTLDDLSDTASGTKVFVENSAKLFYPHSDDETDETSLYRTAASFFEAPTVIRYEEGQVLAPHYDANRSANVEDSNRGGQTLATLLVYLNDVAAGGRTKFGKLPALTREEEMIDPKLTVQPKVGDALLFFPADSYGNFDDRTEHEGCPAIDEKWIARIWRHQSRVPPPFGLAESELSRISK